jgi:hypothetical protein
MQATTIGTGAGDAAGAKARARRWGALLLAGAVAGCAQPAFVSERIDAPMAGDKGEKGGLVYALPMTVLTVARTEDDKGNPAYRITPSVMPDQSARYRLRYAAIAAVDDDVKIDVDSNLLLTTAKTDVQDRTGDILIAAAKTAASVARIGTLRLIPSDKPAPPPRCSTKPFTAVLTLDELRRGRELPDCSTVRLVGPPMAAPPSAEPAPRCDFSLCFRTTMTVIARITPGDGNGRDAQDFSFVAIDPSRTEGIDLQGAPLVKRVNTLAFQNGLLTSTRVEKPSSALAAANLPLEIAKAILSAPAELLTLRYKSEGDVLKGKAEVLRAQKDVLDAQQKLQEAVAAANNAGAAAVVGSGTSP